MSNGKDIQSLKHCGNRSWHFLPMVTCWQFIRSDINFLNYHSMEMTIIDDHMWTIMDIFDEIFWELKLIQLAIKMDDVAALLEPEPPIFDPLKTVGKYE